VWLSAARPAAPQRRPAGLGMKCPPDRAVQGSPLLDQVAKPLPSGPPGPTGPAGGAAGSFGNYGTGKDGDYVLTGDGEQTFDVYLRNLSLAGYSLKLVNCRLFVSDTLDFGGGHIHGDGNHAAEGAPGAAIPARSYVASGAGGAGAIGNGVDGESVTY